MSVKIYEGRMIEASLEDAIGDIVSFRKKALSELKEYLSYKFEWDNVDKNKDRRDMLIESVVSSMRGYDLTYSLVLLPPVENRVLYIPYTHVNGVYSEIEDSKFYGYWDNVDPDEECSEEEWYQRKDDWEKALLKGSGIPSEKGIVVEVIGLSQILAIHLDLEYETFRKGDRL